MAPERFRRRVGFAGIASAPLALLCGSPALAQGLSASAWGNSAPLAITFGAAGFALIATIAVRTAIREGKGATKRAIEQVARLRALVDEYEALLSGVRELTVVWTDSSDRPKILGQASAILPAGRHPDGVLQFANWLDARAAEDLARALEGLRVHGRGFDITLRTLGGRSIRGTGWILGGGAAMRLRPAQNQTERQRADTSKPVADRASAEAILALLNLPAFVRDEDNALIFANAPYLDLARRLGKAGTETRPPELFDMAPLKRHSSATLDTRQPQALAVHLAGAGTFELVEFAVEGGKAAYLRPRPEDGANDSSLTHLTGIINALTTPIAIFSGKRELVQCNSAYARFWNLQPDWLKSGLDERAILDKLRTAGMLPNEPDYQAWRARHLTSYQLTAPRESEPWHLPDGRTVQVIAAPAGPKGGVIYVFEDITLQLNLRSQHRALLEVQRSTLNALSEGVAVFGTNGRLTLSNPRLSTLWKLPTNLLDENPHIDQIARAAALALPDDGATIWRDLKRGIIDLNPTRGDTSGRISRADGRLLDYAIVRLPDGQTLMTFLDVTESANYSRVLKERNDALVTADRLKDAFVQNVSYELRSPLTNIIGFSDLLASESVGTLNERQRAYTDYIRASSVTLGVLIDNILDLATVDAGISELRPEPQDVAALVEKARAGIAATFPEIDGEKTIKLVIEIAPDLPAFIADGTRIVQVLYNLMSSAARYSEPGGEVKLSVYARGDHINFVVEDEGAVMNDEMRAAILQRSDGLNGAGRQRGAGLGLAIVRTFVNLHGGTINVERREPRGSRVIVSLPSDASMVSAAE